MFCYFPKACFLSSWGFVDPNIVWGFLFHVVRNPSLEYAKNRIHTHFSPGLSQHKKCFLKSQDSKESFVWTEADFVLGPMRRVTSKGFIQRKNKKKEVLFANVEFCRFRDEHLDGAGAASALRPQGGTRRRHHGNARRRRGELPVRQKNPAGVRRRRQRGELLLGPDERSRGGSARRSLKNRTVETVSTSCPGAKPFLSFL